MKIGALTSALLDDLSSLFYVSSNIIEIRNQLAEQIQSLNHSLQTAPADTPDVNKAYVSGMSEAYQRVVASIDQVCSFDQEPQAQPEDSPQEAAQ
jgi:hypothetical protein